MAKYSKEDLRTVFQQKFDLDKWNPLDELI